MPHFGDLEDSELFTNLVTDTSFSETHRVTVVIGGVSFYLPLQMVVVLSIILLEDGTPLLLEDGTPLLTE